MRIDIPGTTTQLYGFNIEHHGGECCGIRHVFNIPNLTNHPSVTDEFRRELILKAVAAAVNTHDLCCEDENCDCDSDCRAVMAASHHSAVEIVLADYQSSEWDGVLLSEGFKRVFSFLNSNSDNTCVVYMLETGNTP